MLSDIKNWILIKTGPIKQVGFAKEILDQIGKKIKLKNTIHQLNKSKNCCIQGKKEENILVKDKSLLLC